MRDIFSAHRIKYRELKLELLIKVLQKTISHVDADSPIPPDYLEILKISFKKEEDSTFLDFSESGSFATFQSEVFNALRNRGLALEDALKLSETAAKARIVEQNDEILRKIREIQEKRAMLTIPAPATDLSYLD